MSLTFYYGSGSPFAWKVWLTLEHKGIAHEAKRLSFDKEETRSPEFLKVNPRAQVPAILDDGFALAQSNAICEYLEERYPDKPLMPDRPYARFVNAWADTAVNMAIFPIVIGDLVDRVRPQDKDYVVDSRGKRLGTTDFAGFQANAREKGVAAFRGALEPARRILKEQAFLSGDAPAYPDYILLGSFLWPRTISPLELLDRDDVVHAWRERMLDLFDGMARKAPAAA